MHAFEHLIKKLHSALFSGQKFPPSEILFHSTDAAFQLCSTLCRCVLSIADAPVCATDREELLGALKHETLQLKCEVDASPPAESFHWTFNSSGEQTELPARLHSSEVSFCTRLFFHPIFDLREGSRGKSDS